MMDSDIAAYSYLCGAIVYLILTLGLIVGWIKRVSGRALLLASVAMLLWCSAFALAYGYKSETYYITAQVFEVIRNVTWFLLLLRVLDVGYSTFSEGWQSPRVQLTLFSLGFSFWMIVALLFIRPKDFSSLEQYSEFMCLGYAISAVIGLTLVEQVLRNTRENHLWNIKFFCLVVGAIFAYDFLMYTLALVTYRLPQPLIVARGLFSALLAPMIVIFVYRNKAQPMRFNLQREFVFHTIAIFSAGIYTALMAAIGYYLANFGGSWGPLLQILFTAGALLILVVLVFSKRIQAQFRVWVSRIFFSYKYDYRNEWMRITRTLSDTDTDEPLMQRAIHAIAGIVESPGGSLWMKSEQGDYVQTAVLGMPWLPQEKEPGNSPFAGFLRRTEWVVDLDEYERDPALYREMQNNVEIPDWLKAQYRKTGHQQAWLITPLMLHEQMLGFMILNRSLAPRELNWEDHDFIKIVGRQVASYLAEMQSAEALMKARQFEAFNQMSAFVVHDLKTLVAQLSLLNANATRHRNNPEFIEDMFNTVGHSVEKMNGLLQKLRDNKGEQTQTQETVTEIELSKVLAEVIEMSKNGLPVPELADVAEKTTITANPEQLTTVIGHIVKNAQEATPRDGYVRIRVDTAGQTVLICVEDNGCGMSEVFIRERLFQPFESTKGLAGMGIGVYQCREYIRKLGGEIKVTSEENKGTYFEMSIPMTSNAEKNSDKGANA